MKLADLFNFKPISCGWAVWDECDAKFGKEVTFRDETSTDNHLQITVIAFSADDAAAKLEAELKKGLANAISLGIKL